MLNNLIIYLFNWSSIPQYCFGIKHFSIIFENGTGVGSPHRILASFPILFIPSYIKVVDFNTSNFKKLLT